MFPITIDGSVSARVAIALPTVMATNVTFCRRVVYGQSLPEQFCNFHVFRSVLTAAAVSGLANSAGRQQDASLGGRSVQAEADMLSDTVVAKRTPPRLRIVPPQSCRRVSQLPQVRPVQSAFDVALRSLGERERRQVWHRGYDDRVDLGWLFAPSPWQLAVLGG
jgi:hypothetical protein